ncbi:hypothetical protein EJ06DRAFT_378290 [Trichodelitschia bisporula]|uniref:Uncharacterized protein n=1 Tax=Trichodelitschia bisporula TaxID=703511 RepID=A0A6G1HZ59_9PEZI|nr:hypothetical protein EJ06DRAFT_378290 [Trichodelitschia bisporula]
MTTSKFTELLDTDFPSSHRDVSLMESIAETGRRSTSPTGSVSTPRSSSSSSNSTTTSPTRELHRSSACRATTTRVPDVRAAARDVVVQTSVAGVEQSPQGSLGTKHAKWIPRYDRSHKTAFEASTWAGMTAPFAAIGLARAYSFRTLYRVAKNPCSLG